MKCPTHVSLFAGIDYFTGIDYTISMKIETTCIICGKNFESYNPKPKYCSKKCKDESQRGKVDFDKARKLYEQGLSQSEVAILLGSTQKIIWRLFARRNYTSRKGENGNQNGPLNNYWKGKTASYAGFHARLYRTKGYAKNYDCIRCKKQAKDWCNLTGQYHDMNDYAPMCRKCHRKYDRERRIKNARE